MASSRYFVNLAVLIACMISANFARKLYGELNFDRNYGVMWGGDHASYVNQGRDIQLSLDKSSGAGFGSKMSYSSGLFHMRMKLPNKGTAGVVTSFYLQSHSSNHDELDFEFLGNVKGKPVALQTNIFANGHGNREQRLHLWFDPARAFHDYGILWNPYQVVFFVDKIPIRIFKNLSNAGIEYPSQPMQITASIWNAEDWATEGGKIKIDWAQAPFQAQFQGFDIDGCSSKTSHHHHQACSSPKLWWNVGRYRELPHNETVAMEHIKGKYMTYDYCKDKSRFITPPPECKFLEFFNL